MKSKFIDCFFFALYSPFARENGRKNYGRRNSDIRTRRLQIETLEERALLSVTNGIEEFDLNGFGSVAGESIGYTPAETSSITVNEAPAEKIIIEPTVAKPALEQTETLSDPQTVYVGSNDISYSQLNTLIFQAGNGGTVVFDNAVTVTFDSSDGSVGIYSSVTIKNTSEGTVTFDGKNASSIFTINGSNINVLMEGITFQNGNGYQYSNGESDTNLGGAIWVYSGALTLNDCTFKNCTSKNEGGAICNYDTLVLNNCTIDNCKSLQDSGGAIYLLSAASLTLKDSEIKNCSAQGNGGAIMSFGSVTIDSSVIKNCSSDASGASGGAIYYAGSTPLNITGSKISGCNATKYGGAIYVQSGDVVIVSSALYDNKAASDGAISQRSSTKISVTFLNSTVVGNICSDTRGGAVFLYNADLNIFNSIFTLNYANGSRDDIYSYRNKGTDPNAAKIPEIHKSLVTIANYNAEGYLNTVPQSYPITVTDPTTGLFVTAPQFNSTYTELSNSANIDLSLRNDCTALINTGSNVYYDNSTYNTSGIALPTLDAAGNTRIINNAIDIGAYENIGEVQKLETPTLNAKRVLSTSVKLIWNAISDAASYTLYYKKKTDTTENWTPVSNIIGSETTVEYTVSSLDRNTEYSFYLVAIAGSAAFHNSDSSTVLAVTTKSIEEVPWTVSYTPNINLNGAKATISWTDPGADSIKLKYWFTNNEVDVYSSEHKTDEYTTYQSATKELDVLEYNGSYSIDLIYGSTLYAQMWNSDLNNWTNTITQNIALDQSTTVINLDGQLVNVFDLQSNPTANRTIYLDFTGHIVVNTSWNNSNTTEIVSPVFSLDSLPAYSADELTAIYRIWLAIAEDYAPFNVNVTTKFTVTDSFNTLTDIIRSNESDTRFGIRVAIGGRSDILGRDYSVGGIAYVDSFGNIRSNREKSETPCFIFPGNLTYNPKSVAEAAAHEIGHSLGLYHRSGGSYYDNEYSYGIRFSETGFESLSSNTKTYNWVPIMGDSYYSDLSQWSDNSYFNYKFAQSGAIKNNYPVKYYKEDSNGNKILLENLGSATVVDDNGSEYTLTSCYYPDDLTILVDGVYYNETSNGVYPNYYYELGGFLDYRTDDCGNWNFTNNTLDGTAKEIIVNPDGTANVANTVIGSESDSNFYGYSYTGIIEQNTDNDVYCIKMNGTVSSLSVTVKGVIFNSELLANLVIYAYLYDKNGNILKDKDNKEIVWTTPYTKAMSADGVTLTCDNTFTDGTELYLVIQGGEVLLDTNNNSNYGSLGFYSVSAKATPAGNNISVTNSLTHLDTNNTAITWNDAIDYSATLSAKQGYSLPETISISVAEIQLNNNQYTYNNTTGTILVNKAYLTGNLTITATATDKEYSIQTNLTNCTVTADSPTVGTVESKDLTIKINVNNQYTLPTDITVTIGEITAGTEDYSYTNGTVILKTGKVTGNVIITASATAKPAPEFTDNPSAAAKTDTFDQVDLTFSANDTNATVTVKIRESQASNWTEIGSTVLTDGIYYTTTEFGATVFGLPSGTVRYFQITLSSDGSGDFYGSTVSNDLQAETNFRSIEGYTVNSYSAQYDGKAHGISISGLNEDYTVLYAENEQGTYSSTNPAYTDYTASAKTVWYSISRNGYTTVTGSSTVQILKRDLTIKSATISKTYDTTTDLSIDCLSNIVLNDFIENDSVFLEKISGSFSQANAGDDLPVTINSAVLSGDDANNYQFNLSGQTSLTGTITKRTVLITPNSEYTIPDCSATETTIDLNNLSLFTIDSQAGTPSWTLVTGENEGTGTGILTGSTLAVTTAGTFRVRIQTDESINGLAGRAETVLTVRPSSPEFNQSEYTVTRGCSFNASVKDGSVYGTAETTPEFYWSFDNGQSWQKGNDQLFVNSADVSTFKKILLQAEVNGIRSKSAEVPVTIEEVPPELHLTINAININTNSSLVIIDSFFRFENGGKINSLSIDWQNNNENLEKIDNPSAIRFSFVHFYNKSDNYAIAVNVDYTQNELNDSCTYLLTVNCSPNEEENEPAAAEIVEEQIPEYEVKTEMERIVLPIEKISNSLIIDTEYSTLKSSIDESPLFGKSASLRSEAVEQVPTIAESIHPIPQNEPFVSKSVRQAATFVPNDLLVERKPIGKTERPLSATDRILTDRYFLDELQYDLFI